MTSVCRRSMKAMIFIAEPHLGQQSGSASYTCLISAAQPFRASRAEGERTAIRDVLRDLRQEIQRIEDLEIARGPGEQVLVARFGESAYRVVLGLVDHLPGLRDLDHPRLAEGTSEEVLDEALHAFLIARLQPHALVDAEARVLPGAHIGHHVLGDLALGQKQGEDLLFPLPEERLGGQPGQGQKCAVGDKHPLGHQRVNVGMPVDQLTERLELNQRSLAALL